MASVATQQGTATPPPAAVAATAASSAAVATPPRNGVATSYVSPVRPATFRPPAVTSPQQRSPYRGGVLSLFTPSPATPPGRRDPFDIEAALPKGVRLQDMTEEARIQLAITAS